MTPPHKDNYTWEAGSTNLLHNFAYSNYIRLKTANTRHDLPNLPEFCSCCKQSGLRTILTCCFRNASSRSLKSGKRKVRGLSSASFGRNSNPWTSPPSWVSEATWYVPEWLLRLESPATFRRTTSDNRTFRKWSISTRIKIENGKNRISFEKIKVSDTPCCWEEKPWCRATLVKRRLAIPDVNKRLRNRRDVFNKASNGGKRPSS